LELNQRLTVARKAILQSIVVFSGKVMTSRYEQRKVGGGLKK
jgi:hypothetical protein